MTKTVRNPFGWSLIVWLISLILSGQVSAQQPLAVPALTSRVTDLAGLLQPAQQSALEQQLRAIEDSQGAQVAILIVPTTGYETINQYSIRVVEQWELGRGKVDGKPVDDGLLILIATRDRKIRLEVGYGLEGAVPDAMAKRIVTEQISPGFKQGDYYGGLHRAVASVASLIEGEPLPAPQARPSGRNDDAGDWFGAVFIGFVIGLIAIGIIGRALGVAVGLGASGILSSMGGASLLGILASVIATLIMLTMMGRGGGRWRRVGPHTYRRGGYGGGFGGGGFGGGGFSGGGGGFGGGGASGGW